MNSLTTANSCYNSYNSNTYRSYTSIFEPIKFLSKFCTTANSSYNSYNYTSQINHSCPHSPARKHRPINTLTTANSCYNSYNSNTYRSYRSIFEPIKFLSQFCTTAYSSYNSYNYISQINHSCPHSPTPSPHKFLLQLLQSQIQTSQFLIFFL